jgi:hypothetical protein
MENPLKHRQRRIMSLTDRYFEVDDLHPIDIVESMAQTADWEFRRVADDQIAVVVKGQWREYTITVAWSDQDETLRLICTFEMAPDDEKLPYLYEVVNAANDQCWNGGFTYWREQRLMVFRYGLVLSGGQMAHPDQITTMIDAAVQTAERFYPAFQMVVWGDHSVEDAMQVAIAETVGRA